jgi:hypothetical protein
MLPDVVERESSPAPDALLSVRSELSAAAMAMRLPHPDVRIGRTPDVTTVPVPIRRGTPVLVVHMSFVAMPSELQRATLAHALATLALGQVHSFQPFIMVLVGVVVGGSVVVGLIIDPYVAYAWAFALGVVALLVHAAVVRPRWTYAADKLVAERVGSHAIVQLINWIRAHPPGVSARLLIRPGVPRPDRRLARLGELGAGGGSGVRAYLPYAEPVRAGRSTRPRVPRLPAELRRLRKRQE